MDALLIELTAAVYLIAAGSLFLYLFRGNVASRLPAALLLAGFAVHSVTLSRLFVSQGFAAVALMLATARRLAEADASVRAGRWGRSAASAFLGRELSGATVGLIGFGRIARRVATLLRGFEVRLLAYSRSKGGDADGVEFRELGDLLGASDFVSVHVALTPETRHLIGAETLAMMRRGAILVNTSRGAVVDTAALIDALRSGRLAAAGLDVYEDEPNVPTELRELPNTVLLPHIGSATDSARNAMARLCAENVIAVIEGREPPAPVV